MLDLADVPDEVGRASTPDRRRSTVERSAAAAASSERPPSRAPIASTYCAVLHDDEPTELERPHGGRQLGDRRQLVEVLVVVDVLVLPQQRVRDVHGVGAEGEHGEDVAAHGVADHAEALGGTSTSPRMRAYVSASFSRTTSTWSKWWASPDVVTLRVWCTRSPLVMSTSRWSVDRSASTSGTSGSRRTVSVSMSIPASSSWPITIAGTRPSDTVIAACTIDSVNALTPYPATGSCARSVARRAPPTSTPVGAYGATSSTKRASTTWNESSLCHSVSSASSPMTSKRVPTQPVDRVEVVVDGDPADAHRVGDLLDGAAQRERAPLVEQPHGPLLVLATEVGQAAAELGLDGVDQAVERTVQRRHPHRADDLAVPHQRDVARLAADRAGTSVAPTASTTGLTGDDQRVLAHAAALLRDQRRRAGSRGWRRWRTAAR